MFKRTWLYVGRAERLPRPGTFFTRELPGKLASIVVTRGLDGEVHAFHNVCAHRGNKVVWQEHPQEETQRQLPAVRLQVPRLALRPRRLRHPRDQRGGVLRPRQGLPRHAEGRLRGVRRVHLREPRRTTRMPLRTFLGDRIRELEAYPFEQDDPALRLLHPHPRELEAGGRLGVRVVPPALRPRPVHRPRRVQGREDGAAGRRLPLRRVPAPPAHLGARAAAAAGRGSPARPASPVETNAGSTSCSAPGSSASTTSPTSVRCPSSSTRATSPSWGNDQFWLFPNLSIQIWARNYYITYTYWPESVD